MIAFLVWVDTQPAWAVELVVLVLMAIGFFMIDWAAKKWPRWFEDE